MSYDAKGIGLFFWKIIQFSASSCYKIVRKYPIVSGSVIFVLFVYIKFPSFFDILLYASPVLICTAIYIRFYWRTNKPTEVQAIKKNDSEERSSGDVNTSNEEKSCPDVNVNKSNRPILRPQKSVRRNARKAIASFDGNDSPSNFFSTSINDILSGKSSLLEENSKLDSDVIGSSNVEHGDGSSQNETGKDQPIHKPKSVFDSETSKPLSASDDCFQGKAGKGLEERENVEGKKMKEDRNKEVEWTKDEEKKLMDLGLTETERNRRLESLMAKRRARKLFKKAIEKNLMDKGIVPNSPIAPILIVKNNILGGSSHPNEEGFQPGSAPSILLPTPNPFDLPYDPFEEKPNLTADSFQQEFMPVNQKEMLFCRHQSFHHGPLFTFETSQDPIKDSFIPYYRPEKRPVEGPAVDRSKKVPDDEGGHHHHHSLGFRSEIDLDEVKESNNEAVNFSEDKTEKIKETANDKTEIGETHDLSGSEVMERDSIKNNDSCYSPSSSDDSESGLDQTIKPMSLCKNQVRKAFNLSIPPKGKTVSKLPNDSSPSPRRAEFNLFYNSYRKPGHHTRNCSIASDLQVEVSEVGSPTLLTDGTISPVEGDSITYDGDVDRDVNSDGDELWGDSFNLTREANREKLRELDDIIEEDSVDVKLSGLNKKCEQPIASISPSLQEAKKILKTKSPLSSGLNTAENPGKPMHLVEKTEQLLDPQEKPLEELNIISNVKQTTQGDANTLESKSSEIRDNEVQASIEPTTLGETRKPDKAIDLDSSKYKHENIETSYESKTRDNEVQASIEPTTSVETIKPNKEIDLVSNKYRHGNVETSYESETRDYEVQASIEPTTSGETRKPDKAIYLDSNKYKNGNIETSYESETRDNEVQASTEPTTLGETRKSDKAIDLDSNKHGNIETSHESKRTTESGKKMEESQPSKYIEEGTRNLTEQGTGHAPNAVQSIDDSQSVPDSRVVNRNIAEDNVSLVEQSFESSTTMAPNRRLADEQTYISLCASPRSVLPQNVLADHITISNVEQQRQTDRPQSVMENIARDNSAYNQPQENSSFNIPEITQKSVEKPIDLSSSNCSPGTSEGSSNTTTKSTDGSTVHDMNELVLEGTNGKDESKTSTSSKDANELSKPSSESNPDSIEPLGESERLNESTSKPKEGNAKSDDPKTTVKEKSAVEVDRISNVNDSSTDKVTKNESSNHVLDGESDPLISSTQKVVLEPSKTSGATSAGSIKDTEHESENESSNHVLDGESDPLISSTQKVVPEPSKASGATSAGSAKHTEHESKRSTEENDSNEMEK